MELERAKRDLKMGPKSVVKLPKKNVSVEEQWLSNDLEGKIKHFDEIRMLFVENLGD